MKVLALGVAPVGTGIIGGGGGAQNYNSAHSSSHLLKSLMIIIKFDDKKLVRDFAYRYTNF